MKHEILMACLGYTGDLIREQVNDRKISYVLDRDINFLDNSEKDVIQKIVSLGAYYKTINNFISKRKSLQVFHQGDVKLSGGMYMKSLVNGLEEILSDYRSTIVNIEQEVIVDFTTPLSHFQRALSKYDVLLPHLCKLVYEIEESNLYGGPLLDALYKHSCTGLVDYKECIEKIRKRCHGVMFNQLGAWIIHGVLIDQCNEFFIFERDAAVTGNITSNLSYNRDNVHGKRERSTTLSDFTSADVDPVACEHEWNTQFVVRLDMLPLSYIDSRIADKALFIGKAVHILQKTTDFTGGDTLIPKKNVEEFSDTIKALKNNEHFHLLSLEIFLDKVRACVARALWSVVVQDAKLPNHLEALKDFFLLSNGEFYQCFIDESLHIMSVPPTLNAERDINAGPFTVAAIKVGIDDNSFFKRFSIRLNSPEFRFNNFTGPSALKHLILVGNVSNSYDGGNKGSVNDTLNTTKLGEGDSSLVFSCLPRSVSPKLQGAVWYSYPKNIERGFSTKFKFSFGNEGGGLVFAIQNDRATAIGTSDEDLGYAGIANSFFVEISRGRFENEDAPFIALYSSEAINECLAKVPLSLSLSNMNSHLYTVKIEYDFLNSENERGIKVYLSDNISVNPSNSPILSYAVNISKLIKLDVSGKAFVGFTSSLRPSCSTNDGFSTSDFCQVCNWSFRSFEGAGGPNTSTNDAWRSIGLNYRVSWPLHLIFTNYALDQYSNLFQYLFTVKRVSTSLQIAWASIAQGQYKKLSISKSHLLTPIWSLRSRMAFFVDNMQFYLQVDVIDVQYQELQKKIAESQDFETLKTAHELYLNAIASQSFLHSTMIRRALDDVFKVCFQFCFLLNTYCEDLTLVPISEINPITHDFDRYLCFLFSLIARLNTQLVLKLDFNGFLSAKSLSLAGGVLLKEK